MRSDARANRDRILAAAEEVFGAAGADGSTEEVARRAGVGIGTVFRHFPAKRDLVEATLVRHFEVLTARARELAAGDDPTVALRRLIEVMVSGGATKITLLALLADDFSESAVRAAESLRDVFGGLLRRTQQAGTIRRDVSVDEVYLLIRALARSPAPPAIHRKALAVVLDGLSPPAD
jgi:AcrR family transcriptional regulator